MTDSIIVRKLPDGLKPRLRERAASHGRSVEAEVRAILMEVVFPQDFVLDWLEAADNLPDGADLVIPERTTGRDPVVFE